MGQYESQTLIVLASSLFSGNNTFLITNPKDLGFVSSATVSLTILSPITRIDVNFMSNIDQRFENIDILLNN